MCCSTDFSLHHTLHGLADVSDNSSVDTGEVKPSCFNFLDWDVEKLNEFQVDQIFWSIGEERGHGHGKGALVTLKHKVTCSLLIHSVKICLDCHGGFGWVWYSGKTGFLEGLYSIGWVWQSASCLVFLANFQRQCRKSKSIFLPQRSVLVVQDSFLSSRTIPPGSFHREMHHVGV